jgi:diguanylate cyclase (GGDEF)-like protein
MANWLQKFGNISIGTLLLIVSAVSLALSLAATVALTSYIRHQALHDLAREDVEQTSQIIFQAIYGAMAQGGDRKQIESVVAGLARTFPHLDVSFYSAAVYRAPVLNQQYGALARDEAAIARDPELRQVLREGKPQLLFPTNSAVRNLYPVLGRQECLACHTGGHVGEVFGVIDITYPVSELKVRFDYVLNSMLGYTVLVLATVFALLYLALRKLVAVPLRDFAASVREMEPTLKFDVKIRLRYLVAELRQLADAFNHLLATIGGYSKKLLEYSTTDTLTGLLNRRAFEERLAEEINRSNRYASKFSVLMIDLDDFKNINDRYGHPVGDLALKLVADTVRGSLRHLDLAARLGGDEFAVILPETVGSNAYTVAQRLSAQLAAAVLRVDAGEIRFTCSIGVASYPMNAPQKTSEALYQAVDDRLYRAKRLGKNQVAGPD